MLGLGVHRTLLLCPKCVTFVTLGVKDGAADLRIHSWLPHGALNGSNGWTHNLEAREFANDTAICGLQHNCREQRLTPETR
jgi:hypothetical protein